LVPQQWPPWLPQSHQQTVPHGASLCNSNRPVEIFEPHITETAIGVECRIWSEKTGKSFEQAEKLGSE